MRIWAVVLLAMVIAMVVGIGYAAVRESLRNGRDQERREERARDVESLPGILRGDDDSSGEHWWPELATRPERADRSDQ